MDKLELSEERIKQILEDGEGMAWAKKVYTGMELSEEEKAFSAIVEDLIHDADKFGKTSAKEEIAEIVLKIIEPEVFSIQSEILNELFNQAVSGEFDKIKIRKNYKNTLVAYESAPRTGNVNKSYLDFEVGTIVEKHLQIETELPMSNLRRDGALGVATLSVFAMQEFESRKYAIIMNIIDELIVGGANSFEWTGTAITKEAIDAFTGYLNDNCFDGMPTAIALSNLMRNVCRVSGAETFLSDAMKDKLNQASVLDVYNGTNLVSVKAGKKTGDGQTLLPQDLILGYAGKIGSIYNKGQLRTYVMNDNNPELIQIKFTGYEFGVMIEHPEKIAKLKKSGN